MSRSTESSMPRRRTPRRVAAALLAIAIGLFGAALPAAPAFADDFTGRLVDQQGQPIAGLTFDIYATGASVVIDTVTSDSAGEFSLTLGDGSYEYFVVDGTADGAGDTYAFASESFSISGFLVDIGDIVLTRYVTISGTITNWDASMDVMMVTLFEHDPDPVSGGWFAVDSDVVIDPDDDFEFDYPMIDTDYTLFFQLDPSGTAPYADAFLGGGPDFDTATVIAAGPGPFTADMVVPAAGYISGVVSDAADGTLLEDIAIIAQNPDGYGVAYAITDSTGAYALRVHPAGTYAVEALDVSPSASYLPMTFDGIIGCSCLFTPVTPPRTDVDFALVNEDDAVFILGDVTAPPFDPDPSRLLAGPALEHVQVHVYRPVTGGWLEVDVVETDSDGEFEILLASLDSYRLRFEDNGTWLAIDDGEVERGTGSLQDATPGCFVDTGEMDASWVDTDAVGYYAGLSLVPSTGCGPEPAIQGSSSGGGNQTQPGRPRTAISSFSAVAPTPTPTPSPTPTASETPRPSASPAPDAADPETPVAASGPDLSWLLWVGLGILVIVVIGGAVFLVRRR